MNFREVNKVLRNNGWYIIRIKGSHCTYGNFDNGQRVIVPNHGKKDLSIGVIKDIERASGLSFMW